MPDSWSGDYFPDGWWPNWFGESTSDPVTVMTFAISTGPLMTFAASTGPSITFSASDGPSMTFDLA